MATSGKGSVKSKVFGLLVTAALFSCFIPSHAIVQIANQKFFVDGSEFFIKGMVYQPVPLGIQSMASTGYGGGGLCSAKLTPYDEWKSACFDFDFFDGSASSPGRVPPGPDSWFSELWQRDLPILKELGVNTLRLYSLNPLTLTASEERLGKDGIVHPYGKSHVEFFDACEEAGLKVMAPLVSEDAGVLLSDDKENREKKVFDLVKELGAHPALLAWYIGSDWGLESPDQETLVAVVNEVIDYAKTVSSSLGHPSAAPITHCVSNLPTAAPFFTSHLHMDFLCANIGWEGPAGIQEFIQSSNASNATSWASLTRSNGWPIVIGEAGHANLNETTNQDHPEWFNEIWKTTLDLDSSGIVGSFFFEFQDQAFSALSWKRSLGATYLVTARDGIYNSTQENIFWADSLLQKDILFNAIKEGSFNQQSINYNTNVWQYLARDQQTIVIPQSTSQPSSSPPHSKIPLLLSLLSFVIALLQ